MGIKLKPGDILFLDTAPFIYFFELKVVLVGEL